MIYYAVFCVGGVLKPLYHVWIALILPRVCCLASMSLGRNNVLNAAEPLGVRAANASGSSSVRGRNVSTYSIIHILVKYSIFFSCLTNIELCFLVVVQPGQVAVASIIYDVSPVEKHIVGERRNFKAWSKFEQTETSTRPACFYSVTTYAPVITALFVTRLSLTPPQLFRSHTLCPCACLYSC